jgi:hypothetical protein
MKVLNLYFSSTGNTGRVAATIGDTLRILGHTVDTYEVTDKATDLDILRYNLVFAGSGVYRQLPGKPVMELFSDLIGKYVKTGDIQPASPRRPSAYAIIYCTYGGVHTGINEAVPAVKFMGQLFDHLGYTILAEWYVVGEYKPDNLKQHSVNGRLGDIRGRPNQEDLREVAEKLKGLLRMLP